MFKPQVNVSLSRKPKADADDTNTITDAVNAVDWEKIGKIAQETAKKLAVVAVIAYAAKKGIDTTSEIAIHAAHHAICK